jgi:glycosyltransferase involved in cell wall biosynthesis
MMAGGRGGPPRGNDRSWTHKGEGSTQPATASEAMTARPLVSVVVPCYRYGHFLGDCVASVLGQDDVDVRVLIIDDASPDDSAAVARRLAEADNRVEVVVHEANRGHIATYNEGLLDWAQGDYSVLLSADDLLTPGALRRATAVLGANPELGFVYGRPARFTGGTPPPARTAMTGVNTWEGLDWLRRVCRLGHSVIATPEVVVRTGLQKALGGYLPELPHTGDIEMWLRFAAHADVAYIKGADQAFYRMHATNMTHDRVAIVDLRQRKAAFDAIFEHYGARIPSVAQLQADLDRRLAREALWAACSAYDRHELAAVPVDELEACAREIYPSVRRLPEYWALAWRRRVGADMCARVRPLLPSTIARRLRSELWWRRWAREGI